MFWCTRIWQWVEGLPQVIMWDDWMAWVGDYTYSQSKVELILTRVWIGRSSDHRQCPWTHSHANRSSMFTCHVPNSGFTNRGVYKGWRDRRQLIPTTPSPECWGVLYEIFSEMRVSGSQISYHSGATKMKMWRDQISPPKPLGRLFIQNMQRNQKASRHGGVQIYVYFLMNRYLGIFSTRSCENHVPDSGIHAYSNYLLQPIIFSSFCVYMCRF